MEDETKKLIQEQYAKLPKQLQEAIQSSHVNEMISAIAAQNKLHVDQIEVFENEVMMLMMGFTDPIEFVGELQKSLGLTADIALKIATDTNEQILLPIRERMEHPSESAPIATPSNPPAMNAASTSMSAVEGKSVVMPSAAKVPEPVATPASAPVVEPAVPATPVPAMQTIPSMPAIVKPVGLPMVPHVDAMFDAPTVSIAPKPAAPAASVAPATPTPAPVDIKKSDAPAPPPIYKTDPYHEPID